MRHRVKHRKLGPRGQSTESFLVGLAKSFLAVGKIITTEPRAKELRPFVEKLITKAKAYYVTSDSSSRANVIRLLRKKLRGSEVAAKQTIALAANFVQNDASGLQERNGGYLRIVKGGVHRYGDAAKMAALLPVS